MNIERSKGPVGKLKETFFQYFQKGFQITPDNICQYVYPLVEYMHGMQPDYIMALDSGARLTGLVVSWLYYRLYGPLPSLDHRIHFKKVSHFSSSTFNSLSLQKEVGQMLAVNDSPSLFVIDDWVNTGMTLQMIKQTLDNLSGGRIKVRFGVMRELIPGVADISGAKLNVARTVWRDNVDLIGVKYEGLNPQVVRSRGALSLRSQIYASVDDFVLKLGK